MQGEKEILYFDFWKAQLESGREDANNDNQGRTQKHGKLLVYEELETEESRRTNERCQGIDMAHKDRGNLSREDVSHNAAAYAGDGSHKENET